MIIDPELIAKASVNKVTNDDEAWDKLPRHEHETITELITCAVAITLRLIQESMKLQGLEITIEETEDDES